MAELRLTIGTRNYECDVPVRAVGLGLYTCYQVLIRDKTAKDLEGLREYEMGRQIYNTEQVLFNVCNIGAITTFVLVCLRSLPLSLTTVALTASFWVARELILQDALEFEKHEVLGCVIEGHKKVDPDWKGNIELIGMIWARRMVPPVSEGNINAGKLVLATLKENAREKIGELIEKGKEKAEDLLNQGRQALEEQGLYPSLGNEEKRE